MHLEFLDPHAPSVERIWSSLEAASEPAYFLRWGWIENWLACLPRESAPRLAVLRDGTEPVAACFLARRRVRRLGVVASRAMFVNTTGEKAFDELCLEHNALLVARGHAVSFASLVEALPAGWDELYLPALDVASYAALEADALPRDVRLRIDREVPSYQVDLARVRERGYVELLGSSTRAQLRKARRRAGALELEIARDEREALEIYDELVTLHQHSWISRGERGAFADPWFDQFHRRLIARRIGHGEIQLVRARADGKTLGCLYNFVSGGQVLFYQSGLARLEDPNIKPGYLCHALAIEHAAAAGHAIYDFLGGASRYKQNLATQSTRLVWARVQRRQARFFLEDHVRRWVRERAARQAPQAGAAAVADG